MANYGYDPKVDYSKGINEAIANHDYRTASILEQQRNEKIRGEGLTQYQTTSHYADYLPKTDEINSGMDKLANPAQWSYDYQNDPAWQAYRKEYLREADRANRDTMGAYAAQTGGMPSTAAVGAAQQAGNYYRAQLADRIPELMQDDYSRYMQGREADRADLSLLANMEAQRDAYSLDLQQFAWQKEQAQISAAMDRWATMGYADRSVAQILGVPEGTSTQSAQYQAWQQQQADLDRQRQERLDAADQEYRNWQMQNGDRDDAYSRAMTWIQMGIMPSDEALAAAGIDKAQAQRAVYLANAGGYSGGGSSGGGSRRSGSSYGGGSRRSGSSYGGSSRGNGSNGGNSNGSDDTTEDGGITSFQASALGSSDLDRYAKQYGRYASQSQKPTAVYEQILTQYEKKYGTEENAQKNNFHNEWLAGYHAWLKAVRKRAVDAGYIRGYKNAFGGL